MHSGIALHLVENSRWTFNKYLYEKYAWI